jgi:hypothetical protein
MFEHLAPYRIVIVTGPTRSGTTICARMIAQDTGKRYLDDLADNIFSVERLRREVLEIAGGVIQCPMLSWYVDEFGDQEDVAVVLMRRDMAEIRASNKRAWEQWRMQMALWRPGEYAEYRSHCLELAEAVYQHWEMVQKNRIRHAFEIAYTDLSSHPLWVDEPLRRAAAWGVKNWRLK